MLEVQIPDMISVPTSPRPLPAQTDDGNEWVDGRCWLWCECKLTRVLWIGPAATAGGVTAGLYACGPCIQHLHDETWAEAQRKDLGGIVDAETLRLLEYTAPLPPTFKRLASLPPTMTEGDTGGRLRAINELPPGPAAVIGLLYHGRTDLAENVVRWGSSSLPWLSRCWGTPRPG